jgi:hypothetical protein
MATPPTTDAKQILAVLEDLNRKLRIADRLLTGDSSIVLDTGDKSIADIREEVKRLCNRLDISDSIQQVPPSPRHDGHSVELNDSEEVPFEIDSRGRLVRILHDLCVSLKSFDIPPSHGESRISDFYSYSTRLLVIINSRLCKTVEEDKENELLLGELKRNKFKLIEEINFKSSEIENLLSHRSPHSDRVEKFQGELSEIVSGQNCRISEMNSKMENIRKKKFIFPEIDESMDAEIQGLEEDSRMEEEERDRENGELKSELDNLKLNCENTQREIETVQFEKIGIGRLSAESERRLRILGIELEFKLKCKDEKSELMQKFHQKNLKISKFRLLIKTLHAQSLFNNSCKKAAAKKKKK